MRAYDIIYKKREGEKLTEAEIRFLIDGYTGGQLPDYQLSAWAMAVFFRGMDAEETACLTTAMAESGDRIDLSPIPGRKVDKHSTGGVGDTTTLVLAPLVAAAGVPVAKMSGRGLGHTGGTIDKLESIPGFKVSLTREEFLASVRDIGVAVVGQTGNLAPADKKLYALRDVTATVDSIPLIASSIMSKKIAGGADGIVIDVKVGEGAFMKSIEEARRLGETMVDIGRQVGRETTAVLTDMNQPLGQAVGNALEVEEAIKTLRGEGPADLTELCLTLGAYMLVTAGKAVDFETGYHILGEILDSGQAQEKFRQLVSSQGGNDRVIEEPNLLPRAHYHKVITSDSIGYIHRIDAREIGLTAMSLGAGRAEKGDKINSAVGVFLHRKYGDRVDRGQPLAELHLDDQQQAAEAVKRIRKAFIIDQKRPEERPLIREVIK